MRKHFLRIFAIVFLLSFVLACSNSPQVPTLLSIEVSSKPDKLDYRVGDELDLTGLVVTAQYSDGHSVSVAEDKCAADPAGGSRLETEGEIPVVVSFGGKDASFNVCVSSLSFGDRLRKLEGVSSVTEIEQKQPGVFKEKYIVTFTQPLDWTDSSKGTFEQRVEIGIQGSYNVSEYKVNGYYLPDMDSGSEDVFKIDDRDELTERYNSNLINIEHRFFGKSVPVGFSHDGTEFWDCLTVENSAKDFKSITDKLSALLKGKKIFAGASKGGYVANTMAYYYPEGYDAFVAYVAPFCNGTADPRVIENINESIGDIGYTAEKAASMRKTLLDFEVFCIKNRAELETVFYDIAIREGRSFRDTMTKGILWDVSVIDFSASYWQYSGNFDELREILDMPESTESQRSAKNKKALDIFLSYASPEGWSTNSGYYPYFWQSVTEIGNYSLILEYLREAVISETGKDMLVVSPEMEESLLLKLMFTDEQQKLLKYDDTIFKGLFSWSKTTTAHVIMIYGGCDIWYPVRIPECDKKNSQAYRVDAGSHQSTISQLCDDDRTECESLLDSWLFYEFRQKERV